MKKEYYSYQEFLKDLKILFVQIKRYNPDTLLAIARGGLTMGHLLAEGLDNKRLYSLNSIHYDDTKKLDSIKVFNLPNLSDAKKVVIVDDIVDSGDTMSEIIKILNKKYPNIEFKIATLFYKESASIKPDFKVKEAKNWIDFFWSKDLQEEYYAI